MRCHGSGWLSVRVEIAQRDQRGTAVLCRGQQGIGQRRPVGKPTVIRRVRAIEDCRSTLTHGSQKLGVRGVARSQRDAFSNGSTATSRHHFDLMALTAEKSGNTTTGSPRSNDNVF